MNKKAWLPIVLSVLMLGGAGLIFWQSRDQDNKPTIPQDSSTNTTQQDSQRQPAGFDKTRLKLDEPGSPWWVVNKTRPLPAGYVPPNLTVPNVKLRLVRSAEQMQISMVAAPAIEEMFKAALADNINLIFGSGFRSEGYQRTLYDSYVAKDGQAAADRYSARPGTSEHQTGLTFDATAGNGACHLEQCFENTPEGKWLAANAYKYGFIIRYVQGKESVTGYEYEPWHMRYVGKELSQEMHKTGIQTLEEFFSLPAAPDYN